MKPVISLGRRKISSNEHLCPNLYRVPPSSLGKEVRFERSGLITFDCLRALSPRALGLAILVLRIRIKVISTSPVILFVCLIRFTTLNVVVVFFGGEGG